MLWRTLDYRSVRMEPDTEFAAITQSGLQCERTAAVFAHRSLVARGCSIPVPEVGTRRCCPGFHCARFENALAITRRVLPPRQGGLRRGVLPTWHGVPVVTFEVLFMV
jgi:hypothetical protein